MCRNIKTLFNFGPPVTEAEIRAAALQFVRKISGFNTPSKANEAAFFSAVKEVAKISGQLLGSLDSTAAPKNRNKRLLKRRRAPLSDLAGEFGHQGKTNSTNQGSYSST